MERIKNSDFKPAWWLPGPHLQTLWPVLSRGSKKPALFRERIELPDGDFLDLDWVNEHLKSPIIILLHGLEGSRDSHYARDMLYTLQKHGFRAVLMHFRGCSGEMNRSPRYYHSGDTKDLETVIKHLQQHYPYISLAAIGYSLGGNVLLKWLGETGESNPLSCAISVSVPLLLHKSADRMQRGFSRIYQWHLVKQLKKKLQEKQQKMSLPISVDAKDIKGFWTFDDMVTAPLHGFESAKDYYHKSSSRHYLKSIAVPTLIIHAKDDPFMDESVIPEACELSDTTTLELSQKGGHVGFVMGAIPGRGKSWLTERIPKFIREYI